MNTKEKIFSYLRNYDEEINIYSSIAPSGAATPLIVVNREYYKINFLGIRNEEFTITLWTSNEFDLETYLSNLVNYLYNTPIDGIKNTKIGKIENLLDSDGGLKGASIELFLKFKEN